VSEQSADPQSDEVMQNIIDEEQRVLAMVLKHLAARQRPRQGKIDYDSDLLTLRDQIGEARLEDVPALVAQMERLQQVAARRADVTEGHVDARSPYFGRIVLLEGERKRQVLIGRSTYLDSRTGVQIVDWRDAPVSRVYYRYEEGDDYDEVFGNRPVEGEVLTRRSLAISSSELRRIGCPQGTFLRRHDGEWLRAGEGATQLKGGQGTAPRPSQYRPIGRLGVDHDGVAREDKFLPEIASLIDPQQFDLITKPDSGLVVIQGGAGSGKTTIGLHRMAYLAYQNPKRFRPERMLVVVFNSALARYIAHVLPALGVPGVPVTTFNDWARKLRLQHLPQLPRHYTEDTPDVVVRLKKHPAWLRIIDERVTELARDFEARLLTRVEGQDGAALLSDRWAASASFALWERVNALLKWSAEAPVSLGIKHAIEREAHEVREQLDVPALWSELLTDRVALQEAFNRHAPGAFSAGQIGAVFNWCAARCAQAITEFEETEQRRQERVQEEVEALEIEVGIDGHRERILAELDWEDDALLLRIWQRLRGPLGKRETLRYEHVFVDEAQDLSPVEMAVVLDTTQGESVTLAGDTAQRVMMDNGFSDWHGLLEDLGLDHVKVEPLHIQYRSTVEIIELANAVLGKLAPSNAGHATRNGVPVELFRFSHTGDAVGFLAESLRSLVLGEPLASVCVIARTPEQAREYHAGLANAEVPNVRLIAEQDFPFRAGVDVTDVKQVKGLEFDYVILVEVTAESYPDQDEARHLLHVAATRAAHQLWITSGEKPSPLLPAELCERGY
jgi:DNA helicase-2/ATP-dependent DNA helicase PcrA